MIKKGARNLQSGHYVCLKQDITGTISNPIKVEYIDSKLAYKTTCKLGKDVVKYIGATDVAYSSSDYKALCDLQKKISRLYQKKESDYSIVCSAFWESYGTKTQEFMNRKGNIRKFPKSLIDGEFVVIQTYSGEYVQKAKKVFCIDGKPHVNNSQVAGIDYFVEISPANVYCAGNNLDHLSELVEIVNKMIADHRAIISILTEQYKSAINSLV